MHKCMEKGSGIDHIHSREGQAVVRLRGTYLNLSHIVVWDEQ